MSKKNSLLVDKSKMPLAMGIAFVAFTTQFGGGFASGAQILCRDDVSNLEEG